MKKCKLLLFAITVVGILASCSKDDDGNSKALTLNTWRIDERLQGYDAQSTTYSQISGTFSTQIYQLLEMKGDNQLNTCWLKIYINTIGPPPTGYYTVVPYNKLATVPNAVCIQAFQEYNMSNERARGADEGQTVHILFENGKINIKFDNLRISKENTPNDASTLSVNLRK